MICSQLNHSVLQTVDEANSGVPVAPADKKEKERKKKKENIVLPPSPQPQLGFLETLNHELNHVDFAGNKVFWIVWGLLMVSILFFGFQWKTVNEKLQKQNMDIEEALRLTKQALEQNTEILLLLAKHSQCQHHNT